MKSTSKSKPIFLPVNAKYYGAILLLFTSVFFIYCRNYNTAIFQQFYLLKPTMKFMILISFFIIAISKEKIEDEFIMHLRFRALVSAFIYGASIFVLNIFLNEFNHELNISAFHLLCLQCFWYVSGFQLYKKSSTQN